MQKKIAYTLDEVCEQTSLGKTLVEGLIRSKELPSAKVGRRRLVTHEHLVEYLNSCIS